MSLERLESPGLWSVRVRRALAVHLTAVLLPAGVSAVPATGSAGAGRVEGTVTLNSRIATPPMKVALYPDANRAGRKAKPPSAADELGNVVVYVERVPDGAAVDEPAGPFRIEQRDLGFHPHVLPVVKGATVEFPNRDVLFHNVFSLSKSASFDLGRYPSGASKSVRFDEPGIVKVFCHIHSDMSAVVVVLDNAFFASPDADGRFVIDGLPPGDYRVAAWHERARRVVKSVRVDTGSSASLDFDIPLEEADGG
jgi:plastocyanin